MRSFINIIETIQSPEYLYHGTSYANFESILENGLEAPSYWGDLAIADSYAGKDGVIICKSIYEFSEEGLEVNEMLLNAMMDDEDLVPPNDWKESLLELGSVVYQFRMPVSEEDIYQP